MSMHLLRAGLSGLAIMLVPFSDSVAHEIVGNRFFPATLGIDDPGVNDELSIPTVAAFKTGDDPSVKQRDISGEFSPRRSRYLLDQPIATSARPEDRPVWEPTDFKIWRQHSNTGSSRTQSMSL
jgi:hypothetical protein